MNKICVLLLFIAFFFSCSSTYIDQNDYDAETFDYIEETERDYLGQFSYSGFCFCKKDFSGYQLTEKVQKAATKEYGRNIVLRNVKITDGHKSMVFATAAAGTTGMVCIETGWKVKETTDKYGYTERKDEYSGAYYAGLGVTLLAPIFLLIKRYTITADVYKNNTSYKPAYLLLTEKEIFEEKKHLAMLNQAAKLRQLKEQERADLRIANHEVWVGMTKAQLIKSLGEPLKAVVKDDGAIAEASAGITKSTKGSGDLDYGWFSDSFNYNENAVAVGSAKATSKTNRIQIYYYPKFEIYIKENIVVEIYDVKY